MHILGYEFVYTTGLMPVVAFGLDVVWNRISQPGII